MSAARKDVHVDLTSGILDPDRPALWLVWPWPVGASFCDVVRHFLTTYVGGLQSDRSVARQLAYFEGYAAALAVASTHELTYAADLRWHDELVACVADCVAVFREKQSAAGLAATNIVPRLLPGAPASIS